MAKFDYEPLDLFKEAQQEAEEADRAQQTYVGVVETESRSQISGLEQLNAEIADLASAQAKSHGKILTHLDEADRMAGSFLNNLIASSELGRLFPMATPQGHMAAAAREDARVEMRQDALTQKMRQFEIKRQQSAERVRAAQANVEAELTDEQRLQQKIANARQLWGDQIKQMDRLITTTEDLTTLEGEVPQPLLDEEMQRRQFEQDAIALRQLSLKAAGRSEMQAQLEMADDPQAMVGKMGITQAMADKEIQARKSREAGLYSQELALSQQEQNALEAMRRTEGRGMTATEVQSMIERAKDKGFAVSKSGQIYQADELLALAQSKGVVKVGMRAGLMNIATATTNINSMAYGIARGQGFAVDSATEPEVYYETLEKDTSLPPDVRMAIGEGNALWQSAKQAGLTVMERGEALRLAEKQWKVADQIYKEKRVNVLPKGYQPAAMEWLDTGLITNNENAVTASVLALQNGQSTGSELYDTGLLSIKKLTASVGEMDSQAGKTITKLLAENELGQAYGTVLLTEAGQQAVASTIWQAGAQGLFDLAAVGMQDEELVAALNDKTSQLYRVTPSGPRLQVAALEHYLQLNEKVQAFDSAVMQVVDKYAEEQLKPKGKEGYLQESLNRIVYGGNVLEDYKTTTRRYLDKLYGPQKVMGVVVQPEDIELLERLTDPQTAPLF